MARWRYWAQHALTNQVLAASLPVADPEFGHELNGPGHFRGRLEPRFVQANAAALDAGNVYLYAQFGTLLMWGGLLWFSQPQDRSWGLEAAGWSSYLNQRYDHHGELNGRGPYVNTDPCKIIRDVWAYAQEQPDGTLGVQVDTTTSTAKVGTAKEPWHSYWYEVPNLGDHIDNLVSEDDSPDYANHCSYATDGSVVRRVRLGYPRLGRRRTDITFRSGINIIDSPPIRYSGEDYANTVIATGSGEGTATRKAVDSVRDGRLRVEKHLALPSVNGNDVLAKRAAADRKRRQILGQTEQITVRHHPHAPLGSWQIGDDVQVAVHNEWTSWSAWCRITGWTVKPGAGDGGEDAISLDLARADSFHYGSPSEVA